MPDRQFVAPFGTEAAPADWRLPASLEIVPKMAWATFNGAGAAGSYKPCFRIISDSGHVACEAVSEVIVAAGASADVTWFPGVDDDPDACACIPGSGVTQEVLYVDSKDSGGTTTSAPLLAGVEYLVVVEGTWSFWNEALNVGSPDANAMFPSATGGRVSLEVGVDADTLFAYPSTHPNTLGHQANWQVDLGSGFQHVEPDGGPFATPNAGHLYRYTLTGQGSAATFRVLDTILYSDNYGKLRVTVQLPSGSGTGSGAGSLLPPADTTNEGQVASVVSGVPAWSGIDGGSP